MPQPAIPQPAMPQLAMPPPAMPQTAMPQTAMLQPTMPQPATLCSLIYKEVVNHYLNSGSNVYSCLLDASKAFDRVHYGTLFRLLLKKRNT